MDRQLNALVVDDDEQFSLLIGSYLSNEEITYTIVKSAKQAMQVLEDNKFDFMITDYNMPEMNGFELITDIRNNSNLSDFKIILVTGGGANIEEILAAKKLADQYLLKPFALDELSEAISLLNL